MIEIHRFGKRAEAFAMEYLQARGYCIIERNWRYGHKELDIICTDGRCLVVVEVKARKQSWFPMPEDLLSPSKEAFILEAAEFYLFHRKISLPARFDLISIIEWEGSMDLEHLEDAIMPGF